MEKERRSDNSTFIFNSIFTAMGLLLLGVASWIGINVADIPVMKNELNNLSSSLSGYVQQLNEVQKRIEKIEQKVH